MWIVRVVKVNREYANSLEAADTNSVGGEEADADGTDSSGTDTHAATDSEAWMGQDIVANDGIIYNISDAVIYDYAAFIATYPDYGWNDAETYSELYNMSEDDEMKVLLYTIHLTPAEGEIPSPDNVETEDGIWTGISSMYLYEYFNQDVEYIPHEEVELLVPIRMRKSALKEKEWAQLDMEDPGLELVLCYQPKKVTYHINQVSHVTATQQDMEALQEVKNRSITYMAMMTDFTTYDENMVEGTGVSQGAEFKMVSLEGYDAEHPLYGESVFDEEVAGDSSKYCFVATFEVTNPTDETFMQYLNSGPLCCIAEGSERIQLKGEMMEIYYDKEVTTGKSAALLILEPGEHVSVRAIYLARDYGSEHMTPEELMEYNYYYTISSGGEITTTNNNSVLFIKFPDGLKME